MSALTDERRRQRRIEARNDFYSNPKEAFDALFEQANEQIRHTAALEIRLAAVEADNQRLRAQFGLVAGLISEDEPVLTLVPQTAALILGDTER